MEEPKFYTVEDIMEITHVTRRTVYNYIYTGRLHAIKVGKRFLVSPENLDQFLDGAKKR